MFGIDAVEFVLLLVLGVILFGPEKLPVFARKAARVVVYVRDIANNAQTQLRDELGPEFGELELKDLNPKSFVAKHMSAEIAAIEEARRDVTTAGQSVRTTVDEAAAEAKDASKAARAKQATDTLEGGSAPTQPVAVPFDVEAT